MEELKSNITKLLNRMGKGDDAAEAELMKAVYPHLRRIAKRYMQTERTDHTLQPTALVNEAYMRLVRIQEMTWENQSHFFGIAAKLMRQILIDHARGHNAAKRPAYKMSLDDVFVYSEEKSAMLLALDEALSRLASRDPRMARVVELKFFGGLTFAQVAPILNVSEKTAKRDWEMARAWLQREIRTS
jgi:RNA polymerase sigma factor (TIGR02999 family)